MSRKAIIIGSAPISANLADRPLDDYFKMAVNKSWRLRTDYDAHVFLKSLKPQDRPSPTPGMNSVGVEKFSPVLNKAGGLFLTSGSVTMIAGYWAVSHARARIVSFYGCDLVFDAGDDGKTHYYGSGDEGPLKGNFQYNLRQEDRSIRLFIWALMHRTLLTNSSAVPGTKLCFPQVPLDVETPKLYQSACASPEYAALLKLGGAALAFEAENRTPMFERKQRLFEDDADAIAAMDRMMDHWGSLRPAVDAFCARVTALVDQP